MNRGKIILSLLASTTLTASAASQDTLLQTGNTVIGVGPFTDAKSVFVTNNREWIALVSTDIPNPDRDDALLRNWLLTFREGNDILGFNGNLTRLNEFENMDVTPAGDLAMLLDVQSNPAGTILYWNSFPVVHEKDTIVASGLGAGSAWVELLNVKANSNRQVLALGNIQNTAIGNNPAEVALLRYQLGSQGQILTTEVLATTGMVLPGMDNLPVGAIDNLPHAMSMNGRGEWIVPIRDSVLGVSYVMLNGTTALGREAGPSVVPGRPWTSQAFSLIFRSGINDFGDYIFTGNIQDAAGNPQFVQVKNNAIFTQEGMVLPEFSNRPLAKGTATPLQIANNGDVFWFAQDNGSGEAFMRNYTPIVQTGVTRVGGEVVTQCTRTQYAFSCSGDGRFWVGRVKTGPTNRIVFVDFGLVLPVPGCLPNEGRLSLIEGRAYPGDHLLLGMDNGQDTGVLPFIGISTRPLRTSAGCGVMNTYGEILISPGFRVLKAFLPIWNGTGPSTIDLPIPNTMSLVDASFHVQGAFVDVGNMSPAVDYRLTNALKIEIGAP